MSSKNVKHEKESLKRKKRVVIILAALFMLLVLVDLTPLGGNIRFYTKWIECVQKPLMGIGPGLWNQDVMHYTETPSFQLALRNPQLYCTPIEAERAGYSASEDRYTTPALDAAGEPNKYDKMFPEEG